MDYVYPNKIHQYLAAGKRVISTYIHEVLLFQHIIKIAEDDEQFVSCINESLKDIDNITKISHRMKIAESNSIVNRAKEKIDIIRRFVHV